MFALLRIFKNSDGWTVHVRLWTAELDEDEAQAGRIRLELASLRVEHEYWRKK